jgi:hypothetical protein
MVLFFAQSLVAQPVKVLFIGNSYTYVNNLPQLFHDIALSKGDTVIFDSYTPGGYTLQGHSSDPNTISKINSQQWDFVILQEQSQRPSFSPSQVAVDVYPYAAILDSLIHQNNPCTETVFYMTWGRKYGDASNCAVYPPVCTYEGMQARLRESYLEMGFLNNATVAPVGAAWKNAIDLNPAFDLYEPDESHPSIFGSYLAACSFYAAIFHETPQGTSFTAGLSAADAAFIQDVAALTVIDSLDTWYAHGSIPVSGFSYSVNGLNVQFQNSSMNASSFYWTFGDGTASVAASPSNVYAQSGSYAVTLTSGNACKSDSFTDTITLTVSGSPELPGPCNSFWYDPASGELVADCPGKKFDLNVYSLDGRIVHIGHFSSGDARIPMPVTTNSIYIAELRTGTEVTRIRIPVF